MPTGQRIVWIEHGVCFVRSTKPSKKHSNRETAMKWNKLTPERLDACAEADPWTALVCAADRLTPTRLDECAKAAPGYALVHASYRLTPERLDACAKVAPWTALTYAADRLTPEQLAWCKTKTKGD